MSLHNPNIVPIVSKTCSYIYSLHMFLEYTYIKPHMFPNVPTYLECHIKTSPPNMFPHVPTCSHVPRYLIQNPVFLQKPPFCFMGSTHVPTLPTCSYMFLRSSHVPTYVHIPYMFLHVPTCSMKRRTKTHKDTDNFFVTVVYP
jgi:hypothetical protein